MLVASPGILLSKLTPMKSLLCVVKSPTAFGLAISDPYLGHGTPLHDVSEKAHVQEIVKEQGVGALLFALPMQRVENDGLEQWVKLRESVLKTDWPAVPLACLSDERITMEQAQLATTQEVEMWEDVDLECTDLSTDAAVALNSFLWKHTGGWQNTFG